MKTSAILSTLPGTGASALAALLVVSCAGCNKPTPIAPPDHTASAATTPAVKVAATAPDATTQTAAPSMKKPDFSVPSDEELKKRLTPLQYAVAREAGTERPYTNEYWRFNEEGIYVDIVTGKPLFSSKDKFDSSCGWPAFAKPIEGGEIVEKSDGTHGMERTEVRSKTGDTHLGHVFDDGPLDKGGLRYCINSASLRFVPKAKMAAEGYGEWLKIFDGKPAGP